MGNGIAIMTGLVFLTIGLAIAFSIDRKKRLNREVRAKTIDDLDRKMARMEEAVVEKDKRIDRLQKEVEELNRRIKDQGQ
jgi:peptidoglycan hydrolase CwlO-like protein